MNLTVKFTARPGSRLPGVLDLKLGGLGNPPQAYNGFSCTAQAIDHQVLDRKPYISLHLHRFISKVPAKKVRER